MDAVAQAPPAVPVTKVSASVTPRAVWLSLACAVALAVLTPYVEIVLWATQIGAFAPPAGAFLILVFLVTVVNPILYRITRRAAFTRSEMLTAYVVMLCVAALCSCQFAGWIVPVITGPHYYANEANKYGELLVYQPEWWRVDDELAVRYFYEGLPYGARLPLRPWVKPLIIWLPFILAFYIGFLCISILLGDQWIYREKLPFPLVQLPLELTAFGERGVVPAIFRTRLMWLGVLVPVFFHTINGLHYFFPAIPAVRLHLINLMPPGVGKPWNAAQPFWICIYFWLIALSYMCSRDVPFSIGFFYLLFKVEAVAGMALGIGPNPETRALTSNAFPMMVAQKSGGTIALIAMSLWAARPHLREIWAAVRGTTEAANHSAAVLRQAFYGLVGAVGVIVLWLNAMGMSLWLAVLLIALTYVFILMYHRFMAEGGVNLLWAAQSGPNYVLYGLFGYRYIGSRGWLILLSLPYFIWPFKGPVGPQSFEGLKIASEASIPRERLVRVVVAAMALSAIVAYWATLIMVYTHGGGIALDRYRFEHVGQRPFNELRDVVAHKEGPQWPKIVGLLISGGVVAALSELRWRLVWWRLHPIGFVLSTIFATRYMWFSILFGSMLNWAVNRYGGVKAYRAGRPFFLGLIFGDFFMLGVWFIVCALAGVRGFRLFGD
ncbi:MAG: hypothetical protein H5T86_09895 [Armatimonadetes bacterium]|nr:hypothetical protein [Armatimonadota bacterium]